MLARAVVSLSAEKKCLNSELWHACAGPLVCLPTVGTRVVYFPQGHSEQVSVSSRAVPVSLIVGVALRARCWLFCLAELLRWGGCFERSLASLVFRAS